MADSRVFPVLTNGGTETVLMSAEEVLEAAEQGRLMMAPEGYGKPPDSARRLKRDERVYDHSVPPVCDRLRAIMGRVPPEAWKSLPEDLIDNLDHYIYGTPKR